MRETEPHPLRQERPARGEGGCGLLVAGCWLLVVDVRSTLHERARVRAGNTRGATRLTPIARRQLMDPAVTHTAGTTTGISDPGPVSGPSNAPSRLRTQGLPPWPLLFVAAQEKTIIKKVGL